MIRLKTLLVTSRVTFVPENYNQLVCGLADSPHIMGCLIINNRDWKIVAQALVLLLSGAAPKMGWQLLKNFFADNLALKKSTYEKAQKKFFMVQDLNSEEALQSLRSENIDLILNARTRVFFKKKLLEIPKLGCINIHHGLLPDQRGLMCDFWAHLEDTPSGFTIHQMTPKLDDGTILKVTEVQTDKKNYMTSIFEASRQEVLVAQQVLDEIAAKGQVTGVENKLTPQTIYRRNPRIQDFFKLRNKGVRI